MKNKTIGTKNDITFECLNCKREGQKNDKQMCGCKQNQDLLVSFEVCNRALVYTSFYDIPDKKCGIKEKNPYYLSIYSQAILTIFFNSFISRQIDYQYNNFQEIISH